MRMSEGKKILILKSKRIISLQHEDFIKKSLLMTLEMVL